MAENTLSSTALEKRHSGLPIKLAPILKETLYAFRQDSFIRMFNDRKLLGGIRFGDRDVLEKLFVIFKSERRIGVDYIDGAVSPD